MDRRSLILNIAAVVVVILLGLGVARINQSLLPAIGIVLFALAMFLRPRNIAVLGILFLAAAGGLVLALDIEAPMIRLGNVLLATALAMLVSVTRDRRVAQVERLRQEEAAILSSVGDAIFVLHQKGVVAQLNDAARSLVPSACLGEPLHPMLRHLRADGSDCPGGCPFDGAPPRLGLSFVEYFGAVPVEYLAREGSYDRTVISVRDISERVAADRDRRALLESAWRQRQEAAKVAAFALAQRAVDADLPGIEMDLWSAPSPTVGIASGADLVDISRLPDRRIAFLLVDGLDQHGLTLEQAWQVLYVTRALLFAGVPLVDLLEQSARTLRAQMDPPRASLLAGTLDPASGLVSVASGGHPPPLLVRAAGAVDWLAAEGPPLDSDAASQHQLAEGLLLPGDRLLVYSDGVVDRTGDLLEGMSVLRSAATARRELAGGNWSRALLEAVVSGTGAADPATIMTIRRSPEQT